MKDAITLLSFIRAVHFTACLLALGVCVFDRLVASPAERRGRPMFAVIWRPIYRRLYWFSLIAALLSGTLWFLAVAADMNSVPLREVFDGMDLATVWNQTHFGRLAMWRLAVLALAGIAGVAIELPPLAAFGRWVALGTFGALCGTLAWTGHGQMGSDSGWHVWADATHLLIAGCWPMGLVPLVVLLGRLRAVADPMKSTWIAEITTRFSAIALLSVILLTATGLLNAWALLGGPANLFTMPYGRMLSIKLMLFAGMIGIGAVNLFRLKPRLCSENESLSATAVSPLIRNVLIELLLAGLLMLAVGALGTLPPPSCCGAL